MTTTIQYDASTWAIRLMIAGDEPANYPKSCLAKAITGSWDTATRSYEATGVYVSAVMQPAGPLNKVNESGLRRLGKFIARAKAIHGDVRFERFQSYLNDIELPEVLQEAAL